MNNPAVKDLGRISGDILVYGGPYSNLEATGALFDEADRLGIARAQRLCTGDVAAYCADPVATAEIVFERGGPVVAGNCERQLAAGADECGCGFESGSACDLLSRGWYPHARAAFSARGDLRAGFAACPDLITFRHGQRRVAAVHGGLTDIARFIWPTSADAVFDEEIAAIERAVGGVDVVLAGHSGVAFARWIGGTLWLNAGVIGLPRNDGSPDTRFAILGETGHRIVHLRYDHGQAASKMRAAGLVQGYEATLETGYWPSEDILPLDLRRVSPEDGASRPAP